MSRAYFSKEDIKRATAYEKMYNFIYQKKKVKNTMSSNLTLKERSTSKRMKTTSIGSMGEELSNTCGNF